jgi:2-oxoglutarate dehydrogenase E1 component
MLRETYTGSIGSEFLHISEVEEKRWLQTRLEATRAKPELHRGRTHSVSVAPDRRRGIEHYLHTAYAGQKRFSLEGGETTITALDTIIQGLGRAGHEEMVIGMAHRGRLNVLVNIMGKSPKELFEEFEGVHDWKGVSGDVKYHQGYSTDIATRGGILHVALGYNPSHLEIIDPVTEGSVRARQEKRNDTNAQGDGVLLHGDASFAGQGVVYETLNLSQTRGYTTGGTIHIIINNRIGFTTSHPLDARSTLYCTDVGKVVQAPIFHVNGDDPEAVAYVAQLGCRLPHDVQEGRHHRPHLLPPLRPQRSRRAGRHAAHDVQEDPRPRQRRQALRREAGARRRGRQPVRPMRSSWRVPRGTQAGPAGRRRHRVPARRPQAARLRRRFARITGLRRPTPPSAGRDPPPGARLDACPRISNCTPRGQDRRGPAHDGGRGHAGGLGLRRGHGLRQPGRQGPSRALSGQDTGRGTFFHRHAVLLNQRNGDEYIPLQHISDKQARFTVINSILSEEAALGFEYGFSAASPETLVIWEAQFGDFANGAQVVIDQFIVAAEQKWRLLCGLTLMLPHGYEGQGPEHTSARIERFLQMAAQDNIQVCYPSSPAQMFHLLRRQVIRPYRKPLIIFSPKSTLRRKISFSPLDELAEGTSAKSSARPTPWIPHRRPLGAVLGQGLLRHPGGAPGKGDSGHRDCTRRTAQSLPGRRHRRRA